MLKRRAASAGFFSQIWDNKTKVKGLYREPIALIGHDVVLTGGWSSDWPFYPLPLIGLIAEKMAHEGDIKNYYCLNYYLAGILLSFIKEVVMSSVYASSSKAVQLFNRDDIRSGSVRTNFSGQQPYSISFQCSRIQPPGRNPSMIYIHPEIFGVFMNAVQGKAHEDMQPNNSGVCKGADMSHCGNRRGDLAECRCEDLNRKTKPYIRNHFENDVIGKILSHQKIEQSLRTGDQFQFNLGIFCSGRLLGEEILLFRLLHALHNRGVSGTINVFLIDKGEYTSAIGLSDPSAALDQHRYLHQFLTEICGCLPPSSKINGTIFAEADQYIAQAKADDRFKLDLLIGADMEGAHEHMPKINSEASTAFGQAPLALVRKAKQTGLPSVCEVSPFGKLTNCYAPLDTQSSRRRSSNTHRPAQRPSWELPVAVSAVGVVLIALVIIAAVNSRK